MNRWDFYYTQVAEPKSQFFDFDGDIVSYFTEGQCMALGYELHLLTDWSIVMVSDAPAGSPDYLGHVFVVDSDGLAIDIKGRRPLEDLKRDWFFCSYVTRFLTLDDFRYEMAEWDCNPPYHSDPIAKHWAQLILNLLD